MKFSIRRRVEELSADDIDARIIAYQRRARQLVDELSMTLAAQEKIMREAKREGQHGDDTGQP